MTQEKAFATYDVLGVPVSATTLDSASGAIANWAKDDIGRCVFIRDVHGVMQAQDDVQLMQLHHQAAMVTPDGMPLVWLGRKAGFDVSRTCGPDLMERVLANSPMTGLKHFFYGGKPGVAEQLKSAFERRYPGLDVVRTDTPPFRPLSPDELTEVARDINESGADVVWVGLSTPKQEHLMHALVPQVRATLIGVGAAFDFHTGAVKRAPHWMRGVGLEWSWRLASEPRRLWRRYLVMAPRFVWMIIFGRRGNA